MPEPGAPEATIHDLTPIHGMPLERRRDPTELLMAALEAREREKAMRWWARVKVWGPIAAMLLGGGTYAGVELRPPSDVERAQRLGEKNSEQIRALGKVTVEGLDYLGRKIDKAHPEVRAVAKPDSLKKAEAEVAEQETASRVDKILETIGGTETGGG
jgi:hypothetical protein